jgi:hypothetical protein
MKSAKLCFNFAHNPKVVEHLRIVAAQRNTAQKAIVAEALQQHFAHAQENEFIGQAADRTFAEWDNHEDAVYDKI